MMTNLFSIFDPSNFIMSTSWLTPNLFIMSPLLVMNSKMVNIYSSFVKKIWTEIFSLTKSTKISWFITSIFQLFLFVNLISMIPSSFTLTSQISIVFPIGMICWLSIILYNIMNKFNSMMSHLTPEGAPLPLSPFLVLIEIVSNFIRPITISVRLIANMTAGHLLMHLLSEFVCSMYPLSPIFLPVSLILTSLELMVCLIQAYIFSALLAMYSSEVH